MKARKYKQPAMFVVPEQVILTHLKTVLVNALLLTSSVGWFSIVIDSW